MNVRKTFCVFALLPVLLLAGDGLAAPVRVKANRVILRLEPLYTAETLLQQVNEGDILESCGSEGAWVRVVPPTNISYCVHSRFVENGEVKGSQVRVRLGPSVDYPIMAELQRGDRVVTRSNSGDWLMIEPPAGCTVWVHSALVEPVTTEQRQEVVAQPSLPVNAGTEPRQEPLLSPSTQDVGRVDPVVAGIGKVQKEVPPPFAQDRLVPLPKQGIRAGYKGVLGKPPLLADSPAPFRLTTMGRRTRTTVCFVHGNEKQLTELTGKRLAVVGREYWLKGEDRPVIVPDRITILDDE